MLAFTLLVFGMDLLDDPCVKLWRSRLPKSFGVCFRVFRRWIEEDLVGDVFFGGMSPSELVDWQAEARGREAVRLRVRLQLWIDGLEGLRYRTKQKYFSDVSSFFLHNYACFPLDPSFQFSSDVAPVVGCLEFESLKRIILNSEVRYRTIFLMLTQGLMGIGELLFVNVNLASEVVRHVTLNDGVFRLELPGRKKSRNRESFATFLSSKSDFADSFRDYLREVEHDVTKILFLNDMGNPLTSDNVQQYFHARAVEAGVIRQITPLCCVCGEETVRFRNRQGKDVPKELWRKTGYRCKDGHVNWASDYNVCFSSNRYGVNPHEIRDLMRTRWESSSANWKVAEFMMGHTDKVDRNKYLSWMKYEKWKPIAEYRKALPWLNILSTDPRKVDRTKVSEQLRASEAKVEVVTDRMVRLESELAEIREALKRTDWDKK